VKNNKQLSKSTSTTANQQNVAFGEVIESSLETVLAQSWAWNDVPRSGSLVNIPQKECTLFGIVAHITTGSTDPTRYPFPYQKTEAELLAEQPQIFEFLKTTFKIHLIGYRSKGSFTYQLAPQPSTIHAFVHSTSEADIKAQNLSKSDFTTSWQGRIYISDPEKSFIAKQINIHEKGEYAIKVK